MGIVSGITTFVGHAHGAAQSSLKGVILQRGAIIGLLTALLPLLAWRTQLPHLLHLLGQQDQIAAGASAYIHTASPALALQAINTSLTDYLSAQSVVRPLVLVTLTTMLLTPVLNHVYIYNAGWGFLGAALTVVTLQGLEFLLLVAIAVWHNCRQPQDLKPWTGLSKDSLSAWPSYLSVAIPACAMICLEWWAFEALTLLAGLLPDAQTAVAAIGICFGLHVIVFLVIDGIAIGVSVRVANELGAGEPELARRSVLTGTLLGLSSTLVCIIPMWLLGHSVACIFTDDPQVVATVLACFPGLLLSLLSDSINNVLSGCIRGAGRQLLGTIVNFGAFWCFGLPLAASMALKWGWGAAGLWWAMAIVSTVQALVLACVVGLMDWQAEHVRSQRLVRSQTS
eukprot:GHRR01020594.1.p1 GENE.GHRR01020594.1~~GHRR01020594.1.p1  ORF type:complete len:397 (+),score=83.25 GHRR01020594.1:1177-2367(+)